MHARTTWIRSGSVLLLQASACHPLPPCPLLSPRLVRLEHGFTVSSSLRRAPLGFTQDYARLPRRLRICYVTPSCTPVGWAAAGARGPRGEEQREGAPGNEPDAVVTHGRDTVPDPVTDCREHHHHHYHHQQPTSYGSCFTSTLSDSSASVRSRSLSVSPSRHSHKPQLSQPPLRLPVSSSPS